MRGIFRKPVFSLNSIGYEPKKRKKKRKKKYDYKKILTYTACGLLVFYLIITLYNAGMSNQAFHMVNAHAQSTVGYDVLIDKGFLGHAWFYLTHPSNNFNELGWNLDTRVTRFMEEGLQPILG